MTIIPIVFSTDNNYLPYCGVAISSLIANTSLENQYEIFVLYDNLSAIGIERLENLSTKNSTVKCVCIREKITDITVHAMGHISTAAIYRILIPELFSMFPKILYLDSDIVVCSDVAKLFDIDIGDNVFGATRAIVATGDTYYDRVLNINKTDYFNSGILIINNTSFTNNQIKEKAIELLHSRNDFKFMDQCVLNIVCQGLVSFIDKRWNYEWMYLFGDYDDIEIISDPAIIHYDSVEKPWTNPGEKLADVFWKYARDTVFYEEIIFKSNLSIIGEVIRQLGAEGIGKKIAVYGAGYIGRRFVRNLSLLNICNIVLWVDRDYQCKTKEMMKVSSIEEIYDTNADYIIITILDLEIANKVKEMLVNNGIDENIIKLYR